MNEQNTQQESKSTINNRSEIVFLYDAVDANPNGNPMSPSNKPRIDAQTQQCIVTDVRLKRYIRDQLQDEGYGVYIRSPTDNSDLAPERKELFEDVYGLEDGDEIPENPFEHFLEHAVDARYFGGTFSFSFEDVEDDENSVDAFLSSIDEDIPASLQGPVQFSPGRSLNEVVLNESYNSLTSVIATGDNKEQGGFDLDDERVKYALISFHGVVNENSAEDSLLSKEDVELLDNVTWRALKNQTLSRSKQGQQPRFYLRVEYEENNFHDGDLHSRISLSDKSKPDEEIRNIRDVSIDLTELVNRLKEISENIARINVIKDDVVQLEYEGEQSQEKVLDELEESAPVNEKSPYEME